VFRDPRPPVRSLGSDLDLVRQGCHHAGRQRVDLRSAIADLAVFLVAWLGDVSAVLLIAVRTYRLIFQPELMGGQYQIKPVE